VSIMAAHVGEVGGGAVLEVGVVLGHGERVDVRSNGDGEASLVDLLSRPLDIDHEACLGSRAHVLLFNSKGKEGFSDELVGAVAVEAALRVLVQVSSHCDHSANVSSVCVDDLSVSLEMRREIFH